MVLAAMLGFAGLVFCFLDWRRGLLLCLAIGFLQDPLRKITPGQPVAYVVLVGVFFVGCALGMLRDEGLGGVRRFFLTFPRLRAPVTVFVFWVVMQSIATFVRTGNPVLSGIGLLSYLSPLVALLLGHRYCSSPRALGRWQSVYLTGAITAAATILLAFMGVRSPLFASVGVERVFGRGGHIDMVCGVMRSSEIAAWHAATAACLVLVWSVSRRHTRAFWLGSATALSLVLAVILTGRRKTLGEIGLFLLLYAWLLAHHRSGAGGRLIRIGLALAVALLTTFSVLTTEQEDGRWNPYLQRSASVLSDAGERMGQMVSPRQLQWVVVENGFLGRGAGTGAQGSQYFGGGSELVGGGAEGGLGRIIAELGVPGALIVLWLAFSIGSRLLQVSHWLPRVAPGHSQRFFGFVALVPANAVVFLTAHQIFGDPFVLIVLGFIASSALASPQIVQAERRARELSRLRASAAGRVPAPA